MADIFKGISFFIVYCINSGLSGQGSGVNIAGRIESGYVQCGESILVLPANELASVRSKRGNRRERVLFVI